MRTMSHLATTLFQLEEVSEACDLRTHIVDVRNRTLGPDDPATLSSRRDLAAMLQWIDGPDAPRATHQNPLDERVRSGGDDLPGAGGPAHEEVELSLPRRVGASKDELTDLLEGRPGWRLETSLTPGAPPVWCFRAGAKIDLSVAVDGDAMRLNVWDTGTEIAFNYADELTTWLRTYRPAALRDPSLPPTLPSRFRKFVRWS